MAEVQPFRFAVHEQDVESPACDFCNVYVMDVTIDNMFIICRICLRRLRATLKEAEKALPRLPKVERPR